MNFSLLEYHPPITCNVVIFVAYRLYTVVPRLVSFVEELTNWYVRMNRKRLKGEISTKDCQQALSTLFSVILAMNKIMVSCSTIYLLSSLIARSSLSKLFSVTYQLHFVSPSVSCYFPFPNYLLLLSLYLGSVCTISHRVHVPASQEVR